MIILTVTEKTVKNCIEKIKENIDFIDGYEIRVDFLEDNEKKFVNTIPKLFSKISILTYRKTVDGGLFEGDDKIRKVFFEQHLNSDYNYFDFELNFDFNLNYDAIKNGKIKIIRSLHNFKSVTKNFSTIIKKISKRNELPKIATYARSVKDLIYFYKQINKVKDIEKIVLCMGKIGQNTRILKNRTYSKWSYTSSPTLEKIGQLSPKELFEIYRYKKINESTKIFGIVGNPLSKSRSPIKHNEFFKTNNLNNIFIPFEIDCYKDFLKLAKLLDIKSYCVTIPFKENAAKFCYKKSKDVKNCKSSNSVINKNGKFFAYNTDIDGFLNPLKNIINLNNKNVLVIGAGGAAKAIIYGLLKSGSNIIVLNRNENKLKELYKKFKKFGNITINKLSKISTISNIDLIVQTTSVGMLDCKQADIAELFNYTGNEIAYDIIYKPKETLFIQHAQKKGCKIIYGEEMFNAQADLQFNIFYKA